MVSLGNQARLLAAQAFNKRVLQQKAQAKQAKIDAERREDLAKIRGITSARANAKRKEIEAKAKRESARAFSRVAKGANIGVLTGFKAKRDSSGRTVGISTQESQTRKNTKKLLLREIQRQREIASRETDLERFLKNERAISQGRVSSAELNRQIAQRKARGLSKTPAQKRAAQFFRDQGLSTALSKRARRKGTRGKDDIRATFSGLQSERARASGLGSAPFADPQFAFGGRTKKEQIARGGTFGRRVGGESIGSQLSFINQARSQATSGRINFAQGLLANLNFEGSSQQGLLSIVGQKTIKTPKTFQARLREGVGFFTTEAIPVTKPKLTKGGRAKLVRERKTEDLEKAQKARSQIALTKATTRQRQISREDDLSRLSANLLSANISRGRSIEAQNLARPDRFSGEFSLGGFGVTTQRQQAQAPKQVSFLQPRDLIGLTPAQQRQRENQNLRDQGFSAQQIRSGVSIGDVPAKPLRLTNEQKRAQAEATQRETDLIRATPFEVGELVPATGRPSSTETFFPELPVTSPFEVNLSENIGIGDVFSTGQTPAPKPKAKKGKKGKKPSPTTRPRDDFDVLNAGLIAPAPRTRTPTTTPRPSDPFGDIFGGVGRAVGGVAERFGGVGETFSSFLAIGERSGASDILLAPFQEGGAPLARAGESILSGSLFENFSIDPNFDPAEAGRRTAEALF